MPVLNQQGVADTYALTKAKINDVWNSRGGWFSVSGAAVLVSVQYGVLGDSHMVEDIEFGSGAFVVLPPSVKGIQFRNAVAGQTATITVQLAQGDEPPLLVSSVGTVTLVAGNINFQHNEVAVATENTADFDDASFLQFSVVDDPPNTRAKIGLVNVSLADKAPAAAQVFAGPVEHVSAASTDLAFAAGVTGDTTLRFQVTNAGSVTWGPGNAATDTTLSRGGAGQLNLGTTAQQGSLTAFGSAAANTALALFVTTDTNNRFNVAYSGALSWGPGNAATDTNWLRLAAGVVGTNDASIATNGLTSGAFGSLGTVVAAGGTIWIAAAAAANSVWVSSVSGDTERRFNILAGGTLNWGPGNAATDVSIARVVNSATGTGSFLELTAGAGFGYGTGTGGTATITSGSSGTINKPTGKVTAAASVANGATGSYTVTNSVVGNDDVVVVCIVAGGGNAQTVFAKIGSGTFTIDYANNSGVAQTPVFTFAVIKGAVA